MTDFQKHFEQLKQEYEHKDGYERAATFLDFYLRWAAALESSDPHGAIAKYKCAEECQSTVGTFASGSGEGLASMAALYEIMGKRAAVVERLADNAGNAPAAQSLLNDALAIWSQIQTDPNGLGEDTPAAQAIARVREKLQHLK